MKKKLTFLALLLCLFQAAKSQNGERLDDLKGYRLKPNVTTVIYINSAANAPDLSHYRTLNNSVFFNIIVPEAKQTAGGKTYIQIVIPGDQQPAIAGVREGQPVSPIDFGQLMWIEESALANKVPEYFRYRSDIVLGALTLPFKFRPKRGNEAPSLVDGSINLGPYFGYKQRIGSSRPFYMSAVISGGLTSITYNSANNKGITDSDKVETGFGFQYGGGIVFEFYKIQLGIIAGADYGVGDLSKTYAYQNGLWLAFSLNFSFLGKNVDKSDAKN